MKKISFNDLCKIQAEGCYHLSEKFTHLKDFVEGDYTLINASNDSKDLNCHFINKSTGKPLTITANEAQYLDIYEL